MQQLSVIKVIIVSFVVLQSCIKSAPGKKESVAPSFWYLLAGSYTLQKSDSGIYVLKMNSSTGELSLVNTSSYTENPSFLVIDSRRYLVFSVNENKSGEVSSFQLDTSDMKLRFISKVSSEGSYPCYISIDPTGRYVFTANYGSGNVAAFPVNTDGRLGKATSVHQHSGTGPDSARQDGPHAHMIVPSPDGKYIYSTDLGTDEIYVYSFDVETGVLTPAEFTVKTIEGAGPRHMAFHKSKSWVYVIGELNGTVEAFHYDASDGNLHRFQSIPTREEGDSRFAGCADIHIHPSGKYLYATNRGEINSIVLYEIDQKTGLLHKKDSYPSGGKTPRNFAISPDGKFLLSANQNTNTIVIFKIDPQTGKLSETGYSLALASPVCLQFIR